MASRNSAPASGTQSTGSMFACVIGIVAGIMLTQPTISAGQMPTSLEDIGVSSDELQAILAASRENNSLPSLSVALVLDTTMLFSHAVGYANLADSIAATPRTVYRVASVTKPITATMLVKLAEEGVLRLDDPVSKYLPEYQVK